MAFNKVLLIIPTYKNSHYHGAGTLPTGIGYIGEALEQNNIAYDIIDMNLGLSLYDLKKKIFEFSPDLIGISMMTYMYKYNYMFIQQIKSVFPEIKIVVGGPHISNFRAEVLEECSALYLCSSAGLF